MSKRLLVRDQRGERERLLVGTMTVGRDTRCDISDADPLLSRRHAEFVCRPDSLVVRDLNSRNGISVNGAKVQEAVLRPGDVVKVARLIMTYLGDLEPGRSAQPRPVADAGRARLADDETARLNGAGAEKSIPAPTYLAASPAELPSPGQSQADPDSTRPMIRDGESKTATPVLPQSALATAEVGGRPPASPPPMRAAPPPPPAARPPGGPPPVAVAPSVSTPPTLDPLEDWSLELRPPQLERPPQRLEAPGGTSRPAGAEASRLVVPTSSSSGAREVVGSVLLALVAFTLGALPLLVWRGRIADSYDSVLIVPTALTSGTVIIVFGPPLLVSLVAGILLAWWLRRG